MLNLVQRPDAILIAGPTASGKSKLALELAEEWDGEIVNADSMQIYPVLNVLTARPSDHDLNRVPHHLYGYAPIDEPYSVAKWMVDAETVANRHWDRNKVPVFVGGTGLYFKALDEGLAPTPHIPEMLRSEIRDALIEKGSEVLHRELRALDPEGAEKLKPGDSHRITRALEVVRATGKPLAHFQNTAADKSLLSERNVQRVVLMPERKRLHERINARSELMIEEGALEEVKALLELELPDHATVLKAIGVPQLSSYLRGEIRLVEAIEKLKAATRQYAKRQSTWFRGQFGDNWKVFDPLSPTIKFTIILLFRFRR